MDGSNTTSCVRSLFPVNAHAADTTEINATSNRMAPENSRIVLGKLRASAEARIVERRGTKCAADGRARCPRHLGDTKKGSDCKMNRTPIAASAPRAPRS